MDQVRVGGCGEECGVAAEGLAQEGYGGQGQFADQRQGVLDAGRSGHAPRTAGAGAVASGVVGDHSVAVRPEEREDVVPLTHVACQAVHEEERG